MTNPDPADSTADVDVTGLGVHEVHVWRTVRTGKGLKEAKPYLTLIINSLRHAPTCLNFNINY